MLVQIQGRDDRKRSFALVVEFPRPVDHRFKGVPNVSVRMLETARYIVRQLKLERVRVDPGGNCDSRIRSSCTEDIVLQMEIFLVVTVIIGFCAVCGVTPCSIGRTPGLGPLYASLPLSAERYPSHVFILGNFYNNVAGYMLAGGERGTRSIKSYAKRF